MKKKTTDKLQSQKCDCVSGCGGQIERRDFLQFMAMGAATSLTVNMPVMAQAADRDQLDLRRNQRRDALLADPTLMVRGEPFVYRGDHLGAISLSLGGIGAGCIQINGLAERHIWQIFNNHLDQKMPHSFFAERIKAGRRHTPPSRPPPPPPPHKQLFS